jgi:hypothetical protein
MRAQKPRFSLAFRVRFRPTSASPVLLRKLAGEVLECAKFFRENPADWTSTARPYRLPGNSFLDREIHHDWAVIGAHEIAHVPPIDRDRRRNQAMIDRDP